MKPVTVFTTFSSGEANLICSALTPPTCMRQVTHELSALSIEGYTLGAGGIGVEVPGQTKPNWPGN